MPDTLKVYRQAVDFLAWSGMALGAGRQDVHPAAEG